MGVQLPHLSLLPVPVKAGAGCLLQVIYTKLNIHRSLVSQRAGLTVSVNMLVVYSKGLPALISTPTVQDVIIFKSSRLLPSITTH